MSQRRDPIADLTLESDPPLVGTECLTKEEREVENSSQNKWGFNSDSFSKESPIQQAPAAGRSCLGLNSSTASKKSMSPFKWACSQELFMQDFCTLHFWNISLVCDSRGSRGRKNEMVSPFPRSGVSHGCNSMKVKTEQRERAFIPLFLDSPFCSGERSYLLSYRFLGEEHWVSTGLELSSFTLLHQ